MIKNWIEKTIIGLDLCPFTRKPFTEGKVAIDESRAMDSQTALTDFLSSLDAFQGQKTFETILLVYEDWKISFKDFYGFSEDCSDQLFDLGLSNEYQLVAFHPQFCFGGLRFADRANLVNSSPYPLIHLLRKMDLDSLNLSTEDAEKMSFGNAEMLKKLSAKEIQEHFPWRLKK